MYIYSCPIKFILMKSCFISVLKPSESAHIINQEVFKIRLTTSNKFKQADHSSPALQLNSALPFILKYFCNFQMILLSIFFNSLHLIFNRIVLLIR